MNKVILMGRLTRDPEVRYTTNANGELAIARYTLAVDRRFKKDGEQSADFIRCTAFGRGGTFAEKYLHQGSKVVVEGRIQTGSYQKDGQTVYTTDVIVENQEFAESKNAEAGRAAGKPAYSSTPSDFDGDGFINVPESIDDEEIPFNTL